MQDYFTRVLDEKKEPEGSSFARFTAFPDLPNAVSPKLDAQQVVGVRKSLPSLVLAHGSAFLEIQSRRRRSRKEVDVAACLFFFF